MPKPNFSMETTTATGFSDSHVHTAGDPPDANPNYEEAWLQARIKVRIKVKASASVGERLTRTIRITSVTDPGQVDVVKVVASAFQPDELPYKWIDFPQPNYASSSFDKLMRGGSATTTARALRSAFSTRARSPSSTSSARTSESRRSESEPSIPSGWILTP